MPGQHDIYIFYDPETKAYDVFPQVAVFTKDNNLHVKFRNLTNDEVTLDFDEGLIADAPPHTVPPGPKQFKVKSDVTPQLYSYRWGVVNRKMADPKIIIDP